MTSTPNFLSIYSQEEANSIRKYILLKQRDIEHFASEKQMEWLSREQIMGTDDSVLQEKRLQLEMYESEAARFFDNSMARIERVVTNWLLLGTKSEEELFEKVDSVIEEVIDFKMGELVVKIQKL